VPAESKRLDYPVFPSNPAVQQVYVSAYIPSEQTCLRATGPWTDEYVWKAESPFDWKPVPRLTDREMVNLVVQGIDVAGDPVASFPTDGKPFVFSTLRPAAPADGGAIELKTIDETWLHFFALAAVVMAGFVLTPVRIKGRVAVVVSAAIAVVVLIVFQPMFVLAVLNGALVAAIAIVLIVWIGWYLVRSGPWVTGKPIFTTAAVASPAATTPATASPPADVASGSPFTPSDVPLTAGESPAPEPPNPGGGPSEPSGGTQEGGPQS
jgi:hypothetical protein